MANNDDISIKEDDTGELVSVRTVLIDGKHYPVYLNADKTGALIDSDNPLPVNVSFDDSLISNNRLKDELIDLNKQMKILNKYLSNWHGEEITEEDL